MSKGRPKQLELSVIRIDGGTQVRARIDEDTVRSYAEAMQRKEQLPPLVVFFADDGDLGDYWLADGFHRYHAAAGLGWDRIGCQVEKGSLQDARWYALGANRAHGLRLNREDKRLAVQAALELHWEHSDRMIADHIGVSHTFVASQRQDLKAGGNVATCGDRADMVSGAEIPHLTERVGRDGKTYTVPDDPPPPPIDDDPPPSIDDEPPPPVDLDEPPPSVASIGNPSTCWDTDEPPVVDTEPAAPPQHTRAAYLPPLDQVMPQAAEVQPPVETSPAEDLDRAGRPITTAIRDALDRDQELVSACTQLSRIKNDVLKRVEAQDPLYRDIASGQFDADLTNAYRQLQHCRPFTTCPYCDGARCEACHHRGWVNKLTWDNAPPEKMQCAGTASESEAPTGPKSKTSLFR